MFCTDWFAMHLFGSTFFVDMAQTVHCKECMRSALVDIFWQMLSSIDLCKFSFKSTRPILWSETHCGWGCNLHPRSFPTTQSCLILWLLFAKLKSEWWIICSGHKSRLSLYTFICLSSQNQTFYLRWRMCPSYQRLLHSQWRLRRARSLSE